MSKLGLSSKLDLIKPSASFQVAQRASEMIRAGKDVVKLVLGEPDFDVPTIIKDGLYQSLETNKTHYTESQGVLELRKELAEYIGYGVQPEQIMFCSGCKLGIYLSLEAIINPGDEIILIEPAWVSYVHMITLAHGKSVSIKTDKHKKFIPDLDVIKNVINDKSKGIIINNPSNPSGQLIPKHILDEIVELAKENNLFIIADEIYNDILYEKDKFYSLLNYDYERIIVASGFSKSYAMTGLRLGYVIAKPVIIKAINKLHGHVGSCAPSICQYGLLGKLKAAKTDIENMRQTYEKRKNLVINGLNETIFDYLVPEATFYLLLDISKLKMKSLEAANYLLEEHGIATIPGSAFGESLDDFVRISFATSEDQLIKALDRLKKIRI